MEKISILSFNVKNYKTNNFFLTDQLVRHCIDICYLTETWLGEEENQLLIDKFGPNYSDITIMFSIKMSFQLVSFPKEGRLVGNAG